MSKKVSDLTVDELTELITGIFDDFKPKVTNINIEKLVETINNQQSTLVENMAESKRVVVEALLEGLKDVQTITESESKLSVADRLIKILNNLEYMPPLRYLDALETLRLADPEKYERFVKGDFK